VSVLLGNGVGTFLAHRVFAALFAQALVVADFNGDGRLDLATGGDSRSFFLEHISLLLGNGDGTFQKEVPLPSHAVNLRGLIASDLNGDGRVDLAAARLYTNIADAVLFLGNG